MAEWAVHLAFKVFNGEGRSVRAKKNRGVFTPRFSETDVSESPVQMRLQFSERQRTLSTQPCIFSVLPLSVALPE